MLEGGRHHASVPPCSVCDRRGTGASRPLSRTAWVALSALSDGYFTGAVIKADTICNSDIHPESPTHSVYSTSHGAPRCYSSRIACETRTSIRYCCVNRAVGPCKPRSRNPYCVLTVVHSTIEAFAVGPSPLQRRRTRTAIDGQATLLRSCGLRSRLQPCRRRPAWHPPRSRSEAHAMATGNPAAGVSKLSYFSSWRRLS